MSSRGCTVYDYTKTYDVNGIVHSMNMKGPSKLDSMMRTVYPSVKSWGKAALLAGKTQHTNVINSSASSSSVIAEHSEQPHISATGYE
jgi:hypothetical protein